MSWRASIRFRPARQRGQQRACRNAPPRWLPVSAIHAQAVAATLHRAFEHIADVQLTSQLLYVNGFALERERCVARNHERATDARQVRGQALGYTINERIAADVCK